MNNILFDEFDPKRGFYNLVFLLEMVNGNKYYHEENNQSENR